MKKVLSILGAVSVAVAVTAATPAYAGNSCPNDYQTLTNARGAALKYDYNGDKTVCVKTTGNKTLYTDNNR